MQLTWKRTVFAILGLALGLGSGDGWAAGPGVPSLSSTADDFIGYAITNAPGYYTTGAAADTNNTPADNPLTNAGAELGRVLFYDGRLSHNNGTSCASCHVQENGFGDPNQFSVGFEGGLTGRHSTGLTNAAFYARGRFFWDERAATLEDQVLMPIQDAVEMGSDLEDLVDELAATDYYPVLFERAFGDSEVTSERMAKAMAQFVRSMVSYQSKFDTALQATQLSDVLNPQEMHGNRLFGANCASCHATEAQVADRPRNIGLDADGDPDADLGAGNGEFKVPSLRNAAVRGGFMHDGRFSTLEEVVEFYSTGVLANSNLDNRMVAGGFNFTQQEQNALLAFLNTLTDEAFLAEEIFSDPFVQLAGDYDGDGIVDVADYAIWRESFGLLAENVSGPLFADGNSDGVVDAADFSVWRNNLGARWDDGISLSTAAASVPEPSAVWLLASWFLLKRRRDRSGFL